MWRDTFQGDLPMLVRWVSRFVFGFLAIALVAGPACERVFGEDRTQAERDEAYYELFKMLADALDEVERNYVEEVDRRELMEEAIEGLINKLDPYSDYIPPDELARFRSSVESKFGGIGIQVAVDNGQLKVLSPMVDTPAYRAGVRAGDAIIEIEGESTEGTTLSEAVKRMKGEPGTELKLVVIHANENRPVPISVERDIIRVETVLGDRRKADDSWDYLYDHRQRIGYIRLTAFSRDTARSLRAALVQLKRENIRGLVLDLRFNPGGLLTSAIEICDLFIPEGVIVSTEGRNSKKRSWSARKPGTFEDFPMVVLVNKYSASASEIVAGCLQDHERAVIVGERSWGKGSVQNVIELEGGKSALKLTTSGYHRPSGKNIHRFPKSKPTDVWGVSPTDGYDVPLTPEALARLMQDRRARDIVQSKYRLAPLPKSGRPPEPEFDEPRDAQSIAAVDPQLQRALDYLSTEIARGE
jgi:carboxyl-terminal processing protease